MFMNDFKVAYEKLNNQIKETRKIERQRRKEQSELENQLIKAYFKVTLVLIPLKLLASKMMTLMMDTVMVIF